MNEAYGPVADEVRSTTLLGAHVEWTVVDRADITFGRLDHFEGPDRVIVFPWKPYDELATDYLVRFADWREHVSSTQANLTPETLTKLAMERHEQVVKEVEASRARSYYVSNARTVSECRAEIEGGYKSLLSILERQEPKMPDAHRGVVVSVMEAALHTRDVLTQRLWLVPLESCRGCELRTG